MLAGSRSWRSPFCNRLVAAGAKVFGPAPKHGPLKHVRLYCIENSADAIRKALRDIVHTIQMRSVHVTRTGPVVTKKKERAAPLVRVPHATVVTSSIHTQVVTFSGRTQVVSQVIPAAVVLASRRARHEPRLTAETLLLYSDRFYL
eukprot:TRINITY_DN1218_c0_g1_i2.p2 TRINITY_DN1218_c0_g1~~TRINITY_DN1218_c0_g1_i2.p2  ORF type:complete len:146 (+),score=20.46 TRINITY_DN1218_c0_g1_i2:629-1066(+)